MCVCTFKIFMYVWDLQKKICVYVHTGLPTVEAMRERASFVNKSSHPPHQSFTFFCVMYT